jgi:hypothetical protein
MTPGTYHSHQVPVGTCQSSLGVARDLSKIPPVLLGTFTALSMSPGPVTTTRFF